MDQWKAPRNLSENRFERFFSQQAVEFENNLGKIPHAIGLPGDIIQRAHDPINSREIAPSGPIWDGEIQVVCPE